MVSDPAQLPRWWPGVTRVEEATPEAWTTVLASPRGKVVRADFTRLEFARASAVVAPGAGGIAVRAHSGLLAHRPLALARRAGGTQLAIELDNRPARLGALRAAAVPRRRRAPAPRRPGRPGRPLRRTASREVVGVGRGWPPGRAARCRRESAAQDLGSTRPRAAARWRLRTCALPDSRLAEAVRSRLEQRGRGRARLPGACARMLHSAGKSYPDLVRLRAATPRALPTRWSRRDRPGGGGRAEPLRRGAAWRWCPSAAARAWWEAWSRSGTGSRGRCRSTSAASTASTESIASPSPPASGPGCSAPRPSGVLAREGLTLGHLPQSFEYLDGGRLGGHPLGRAGLHGLRADRRVGRGAAPGGSGGRADAPGASGQRRGTRPARAGGGLRGCAGRDLRGHPARARRSPERAPLRGLVVPVLRRGLRGAFA